MLRPVGLELVRRTPTMDLNLKKRENNKEAQWYGGASMKRPGLVSLEKRCWWGDVRRVYQIPNSKEKVQ